jgi:glutamine synthetase
MQDKVSKILKKFNDNSLYPALGVEIEFYILGKGCERDVNNIVAQICDITKLEVQQEKGYRQYEIASDIYYDVYDLINFVQNFQSAIKKINILNSQSELEITFNPKPYKDDYGSGMHIHMSLLDVNGMNLFNNCNEMSDNNILMHSIGGILTLLNQSLYMLTSDDEYEFERFNICYMSPTNISWGKNNRTTAVRIPDSMPCKRNRRIEFRVPSAQSDIFSVVVFVLTSTFYGIKHSVKPLSCVYGNAYSDIYDLQPIHKSLKDTKDDFHFWKIFEEICSNI